jgi:L-amino acid N-acyltransferase YncA
VNIIRPARAEDAQGMSEIHTEIISHWQSARSSGFDHVLSHYLNHRDQLATTVAQRAGKIIGFQSLKLAVPDNVYDVTLGWGVIGTYVRLDLGRTGVGSLLFEKTLVAAKAAKLPSIDTTIAKDNTVGLAYYSAIWFIDYRERERAISTRLKVSTL